MAVTEVPGKASLEACIWVKKVKLNIYQIIRINKILVRCLYQYLT